MRTGALVLKHKRAPDRRRAPAIPAMVPPVMTAMAWRMMFGVKYGAINNL